MAASTCNHDFCSSVYWPNTTGAPTPAPTKSPTIVGLTVTTDSPITVSPTAASPTTVSATISLTVSPTNTSPTTASPTGAAAAAAPAPVMQYIGMVCHSGDFLPCDAGELLQIYVRGPIY